MYEIRGHVCRTRKERSHWIVRTCLEGGKHSLNYLEQKNNHFDDEEIIFGQTYIDVTNGNHATNYCTWSKTICTIKSLVHSFGQSCIGWKRHFSMDSKDSFIYNASWRLRHVSYRVLVRVVWTKTTVLKQKRTILCEQEYWEIGKTLKRCYSNGCSTNQFSIFKKAHHLLA